MSTLSKKQALDSLRDWPHAGWVIEVQETHKIVAIKEGIQPLLVPDKQPLIEEPF
jgi:hypothetical protein